MAGGVDAGGRVVEPPSFPSPDGPHRSLLNLSLSVARLGMPYCQLAGSVPVKRFSDTCSVCKAGRRSHESGNVPAVKPPL